MRAGRRFRTAVAGGLAALLCAATLSGCGPETVGAAARPSPKPSPTPVWDRSPASIAAVGDSITRGFDACSVLADCPEVSWSTGTETAVNSLALRLLGPAGAAARSWNLARTGARMAELPEQMARAAAEKPELVTVMAGANDACRDTPELMTPVADFKASFAASMARLRAGAPKAQVYVTSVPDLKRLWSTGRDNPMSRQIWKLGICGSMLADPEDLGADAEKRRARVHERVIAYNGALREVCAADPRCRYDGGAVFGFAFDGEQLSPWDFFHPSKDGQARLAEIAYRQVTRV
ncbi:SGNH/GDSL hydrolase family protein [Streptomyces solicathayae]|uniref:SGNH/GDSL hydrolase family protein n=1 Tax=Streptomyces solicathayae TaxID=3081768 RepID=A0ABZ0LYE7_9ACTN|nr:SGNH/GDSL hydrolase family protein [Streptomyces sp. HUAS YS2]WOX24547.1 SGNH/GDSL hydrolase family protein [Streptomyces sp. HUAS YS2]